MFASNEVSSSAGCTRCAGLTSSGSAVTLFRTLTLSGATRVSTFFTETEAPVATS